MRFVALVLCISCGSATTPTEDPTDVNTPPVEEVPTVEPEPEVSLIVPRATQATESGMFEGKTIVEAIVQLRQRMYAIGETSGSLAEWDGVMEEAATYIAQRSHDPARAAELVATEQGLTPLLLASRFGYHRVAEVLLEHETVREGIENPDPNGLTPWQLANLAQELTLLTINASAVQNPFAMVPVLVKAPYYGDSAFSPYHRTRHVLEQAGASSDLEPLRAFLLELQVCPDDVKEALRASGDILDTLRTLSLERFEALTQQPQ